MKKTFLGGALVTVILAFSGQAVATPFYVCDAGSIPGCTQGAAGVFTTESAESILETRDVIIGDSWLIDLGDDLVPLDEPPNDVEIIGDITWSSEYRLAFEMGWNGERFQFFGTNTLIAGKTITASNNLSLLEMLAGHSNVIAGNLGIGGGEWLFRAETGATTFSGILSYMAAPSAFDIIGTVVLDGAILELGDFAPSAMTLLNNDGTDAVQGSFLGLAEGSIIDWQGQDFSISYSGGDGNDVTLSRVSVTQPDSQVPLSNSLLLVAIGGLALVTVSGGRRRAE